MKTRVNKWHLINLKIFYTANKTINKTKRQSSEWEKIFANEAIDKGLISKIYKLLIQFNIKQMNNLVKNQVEELNRHFSREDIQTANTHKKNAQYHCQRDTNKITMRCHLRLVRMIIINKSTNNKSQRGSGEKGIPSHCSWECKLIQPLRRTVCRFLKKLKIELPYDPVIPLLSIYPNKTII